MSWLGNDRGDDLDSALARAAARGVPVLACWTAAWCPPCNELKLTVFDDPLFARFEDALVCIRLDGDAPGAQLFGERLGARSYPTTLLLDAKGEERLRLPGGLTAAEFARALDLAVGHGEGIGTIVERLERCEVQSDAAIELLAVHWWGVDDRHGAGARRLPMLQRALAACPRRLGDARLRLLVQVLIAAARADAGRVLDDADALSAELLEALASPAARYSNLYLLIVDLTVLRVLGSARRAEIDEALVHALDALLADDALATTARLIALSARLTLARRDGSAPPRALLDRVRAAVADADRTSTTVAARQTAMNMAGHLLKAAGFVDESVALFEREIARSPHAGYFWPYVAQTRLEQQRSDDALAAWRNAWQTSPSGCARFGRGALYVAKLAEIQPHEHALIEAEALAVLREVGTASDAVAGLNRDTVARLLKALAASGSARTEPPAGLEEVEGCEGGICRL